jgi:hypothetical protein
MINGMLPSKYSKTVLACPLAFPHRHINSLKMFFFRTENWYSEQK